MFSKILACTDGSENSFDALRVTAGIAKRFNSEVLCLNVYQDPRADYAYLGAFPMLFDSDVFDRIALEQKDVMKRHIGALFEQLDIDCRILVETGYPVHSILYTAEMENVDMIVVGSRGITGVKEFVLGSVSSGVLHHARCPVLIVRGDNIPSGVGEFESILLASDGSEGAHEAANDAIQMAQKHGVPLHVLNVYRDLSTVSLPGEDNALISEDDAKLYARRLLELVRQDVEGAANAAGVSCSFHQEIGHPGETIVRFADRLESDLIILGTRRLGGVERMLVGSVSSYVTHHANGAVLVVR